MIKRSKKIYFKDAENTKTITELLQAGYSTGYFQTTYKNKECTISQCHQSARRSFEDLLSITRTYFPRTSEIRLMQALIYIDIPFYFCGYIKKIVFHISGSFTIDGSKFLKSNVGDFDFDFAENTYTLNDLNKIYKKLQKSKKIIK